MKIFNFDQASIFILKGCKVVNCGKTKRNNRMSCWIDFEEDSKFYDVMKKWNNKEFM